MKTLPIQEAAIAPDATAEPAAVPLAEAPDTKEGFEDEDPDVFPIVGIGASAGGLAAFQAFFSGIPADADPGMAFVLVQHLAPDHESILADLLRRSTRLEVFEVEDGTTLRPDCVYVIPPGHDMRLAGGRLRLSEPGVPARPHLPIDTFFRSLACEQRDRAIAVILSGTGSDGTLGVRAVKEEGGLVLVQDPVSSEFDGMPRSAIAAGVVDDLLVPAEMPARLMAYVARVFNLAGQRAADPAFAADPALKEVFSQIRLQTGHDFSLYKPSTIRRRIERRMAVQRIVGLADYVRFLRATPVEAEVLFRDLLIGVTSFFRDEDAFRSLAMLVLLPLLADKSPDDVIRVWSTGCSTGEEAYSLAILFQECLESSRRSCRVQIFATDVDSRAIAVARTGLYPASIAADVSSERLARFFSPEADGNAFRIRKGIRDMIVFSEQDVVRDPPFSRLDLVVCRNLLIYLGPELQWKLIPMFRRSLKPGGVLFLGTSESLGQFHEQFAVVDRKAKLFRKADDAGGIPRGVAGRFVSSTGRSGSMPAIHATKEPVARPLSPRELTEAALLKHVVPAGALVNSRGDILYLHGRTGMYLEPTPGEPGVNNILRMAREGLSRDLTTALHKAATGGAVVRYPGLRVRTNGDFTILDLSVLPLAASTPADPLFLVVLQEAPLSGPESVPHALAAGDGAVAQLAGGDDETGIEALRQQLRAQQDHLEAANEELETSNEELRAANEEMQSMNEELQSSNEEMETSREELQSVNEELATVNAELLTRITDLSRSNNDMNNLLAGTGIGTVFVDHDLRILRFTPAASRIINLIPGDVGRPLSHVVSNLVGYDRLMEDARKVLDTLVPVEVEVRASDGEWYTLRILPYRTLENVVEGVVITFVCVTEVVRTRGAQRRADELLRLAVVVRDAADAITVQRLDGSILAWNPGAVRMYGWTEEEALRMNVRDRIPIELRDGELARMEQLSHAEILEPCRTRRLTRDGADVEVWLTSTALTDEGGITYAVATTERVRQSPAAARTTGLPDVH